MLLIISIIVCIKMIRIVKGNTDNSQHLSDIQQWHEECKYTQIEEEMHSPGNEKMESVVFIITHSVEFRLAYVIELIKQEKKE